MQSPTRVPFDIGPIHFIGIGGIGMSGIAEIMHNLGYKVQGSDSLDSANVKRLRALGIPVQIGQAQENLKNAVVVVYSSAVKACNPELDIARQRKLPLVRRAEMLAEIMRLKNCVAIAGTNGKTTTTTLVAALLDAGGLDPTVVNGGIINAYGTNARLGAGEWVVVEADESDGTFLRLPATVAVVTNVDPDHLDERLKDTEPWSEVAAILRKRMQANALFRELTIVLQAVTPDNEMSLVGHDQDADEA